MFDSRRLKAVLSLNGLTLADFAGLAGVSPNLLRQVLAGYQASPSTRRALLLAYAGLEKQGLDARQEENHG